jgi:AhpD family alkylhydroperoxidase
MNEGEARILLVDTPSERDQAVFDLLRKDGGAMPNLYRALANVPGLLTAWVAFAWPLRKSSVTPRALRELAITYLAMRRSCEYALVQHRRFARKAGVSEEKLAALDGWVESNQFDEIERTVLRLVDDVVASGTASAESISECRRLFGDDGTVELVVTVGFYEAVCVINRSLGVPLES